MCSQSTRNPGPQHDCQSRSNPIKKKFLHCPRHATKTLPHPLAGSLLSLPIIFPESAKVRPLLGTI